MPLYPWSAYHRWKIWQLPIKNKTKCFFSSNNWSLKIAYRTKKWLTKSFTWCEFGSQNHIPDENLAIKYFYQTWLFVNIFLPDNSSWYKILNNFQPNVCSWPRPNCNVSASASAMSLSSYIVIVQTGEERNSPNLNLALGIHGLESVYILRIKFWTHTHPTPTHYNQYTHRFFH